MVQLDPAWLRREAAADRMLVERALAERAFGDRFHGPVLRFVPHAAAEIPGEDPSRELSEWLRVIAAGQLLARRSSVSTHRVISDRRLPADGVSTADGEDAAAYERARRVSEEMDGVTRLLPREFASL